MMCGFGQISLNLEENDQVSLEVFVGSNNSAQPGARFLRISHRNIESPFYHDPSDKAFQVTRGPTLTITKIGDVQPDTL